MPHNARAPDEAGNLPLATRRRALSLGLVNGALWAGGNALTTGPLVSYLARDLGAAGLGLSLILAAPNLAGVLRLVAPAIIYQARSARRASLGLFLVSYLLLLGLPALASGAIAFTRTTAVSLMIGLLFVHQLLEYLGSVALWSWLGDLVPERLRGRYFGRRQMWQLSVSIPALLASGYFADQWRAAYKDEPDRLLLAYAIPTGLGALLLLASLIPLVLMPATRRYPRPDFTRLRGAILAPFADRRFWGVLLFRGWFSLANGVSQTVQNVFFPREVLGLGTGPLSALRVVTQVGQLAAARPVGALSDRIGNRPVLVAAQLAVSLALVFFLVARPTTAWLLVGAWLLFSAYVAHNICLPNLTLKLSPPVERPGYVAASEAIGSVLHAGATVAGGVWFDYLQAHSGEASAGSATLTNCLTVLFVGLLLRLLAVPLAALIREPGARRWREILFSRQ